MSAFKELLKEAKIAQNLLRAQDNKKASLLYMSLMTLSNMHTVVAQTYKEQGDDGKHQYHMSMAQRFLAEANKHAVVKNS